MKLSVGQLVLTGLIAMALSGATRAAAPPAQGVVALGGELLFELRADTDLEKDKQARVNDSYDRLRYILGNPNLKAGDILVKPLGDYGAKIVANNQLIVPIGRAEASAHQTTPMLLAKEWARHLRKVLPKLNARPDLFSRSYNRLRK